MHNRWLCHVISLSAWNTVRPHQCHGSHVISVRPMPYSPNEPPCPGKSGSLQRDICVPTDQTMSLSFAQRRKLRECHEYRYALNANYSLRSSVLVDNANPGVGLTTSIAGDSFLEEELSLKKQLRLRDGRKRVRWADEAGRSRKK